MADTTDTTGPAGATEQQAPAAESAPDSADAGSGAEWADTAERADAAETAEPGPDTEPDTFTREYVTELRRESAEHRTRARDAEARAETLAETLWNERVAALGLLADPADLPYDAEALDDPAEIRRQADELLTRRPHLRTRRISARAGQGEGVNGADGVSITGIMRSRA